MAENVVRVCAQADIAPETVKAFEVGDSRLAVYNIAGQFYVTDDECTHASASLADGLLGRRRHRMLRAFRRLRREDRRGESAALPGGAAHL